MRYITTLILMWILSMQLSSQIVIVKDQITLLPIEFVNVMDDAASLIQKTNNKGEVDISSFKDVTSIKVYIFGYAESTTSYKELIDKGVLLLSPSINTFNEVVVSANRWGQTSRTSPSKISIIRKVDAQLLTPQSAADLLGISGEVFIQKSQQGGGSPMIRGFSTNRLLYAIDGIRMNSAIFRAGNIQNVISLDPFTIQQTEVLFGPGSVLYGSDAIGGVMSFQTLQPVLSKDNKLKINGNFNGRLSSANNEITSHVDVKLGWKKWASVTSFSNNIFGDVMMGKYGPEEYLRNFYVVREDGVDKIVDNPNPRVQTPTGYNQHNIMQKIKFQPNERFSMGYDFHYSETSDYSRYDRLVELTPAGMPRSAVWNYGPQIWSLHHLYLDHQKRTYLYDQLSFKWAYQYFEESRIDRNFSGGQRFRLRTNLEKVHAYSANVDLEKKWQNTMLFYGTEYVINDVVSNGTAVDIRNQNPIAVPDRYPNSTWHSLGLYAQTQHTLSQKTLLQIGARYTAFGISSDFSRHLQFYPFDFNRVEISKSGMSSSVGFVYSPNDAWKLNTNFSLGFRAPNVDDIGKIFDFQVGEVIVPNPKLNAEYAYNFEIGASKVLNEKFKFNITGFYTYLDNAMVRRPFLLGGQDSILYGGVLSKVYAIQNAAYGTVVGVNVGVDWMLTPGLVISSKYNYQSGVEELDNGEVASSRHAAPAFGSTSVTHKFKKFTFIAYSFYNAEVKHKNLNPEERGKIFIYAKDSDGKPYSPSWYTINFKAMYKVKKDISLTVGIENVTDQRYRPYSSGLVAPGRNFVISANLGF